MDFVGHVVVHSPQPKHLFWLNWSLLFMSCLAWNWQRCTHVPQFSQVSVLFWAMYSEATTWFGMPNLTRALNEWQQHEQQLQMTSGFSLSLKVKAKCTSPASWLRFRVTRAWAREIRLAPRFMASFASLSRLRQTSKGASHLCHFALQPQSSKVMICAVLRMFSTLDKSRIVC